MEMKLNITINFDMDGTIADLYGVENWLAMLTAEDTTPYEDALPLLRLSALARRLNNLQRNGYQIAIISWLSKTGSAEYNERCFRFAGCRLFPVLRGCVAWNNRNCRGIPIRANALLRFRA